MGNRAVITTSTSRTKGVGIYLHWNGGPESILGFLAAAKARGFRDPAGDSSYAMARLVGLIHEFFGIDQDTSLGIGTLDTLDTNNFDNGVYVIGRDWTITDRWGEGSTNVKTFEQLSEDERERCNAITESLLNNRMAAAE